MAEGLQCGSFTGTSSTTQLLKSLTQKACQSVPQSLQVTPTTGESDPFEEFLIIDRQYPKYYPFYLTLLDSASFSGFKIQFYLNRTQKKYCEEYSVLIKGIKQKFPPCFGGTKMQAQEKAAELALKIISRYCYTVKQCKAPLKEISLNAILDDKVTLSSLSVSQPLKDVLTESSCIKAVPDRILNSNHQENNMQGNTRDNTSEPQMSSASENMYSQCSELTYMCDNKSALAFPVVSNLLKYSQTEHAWTEEKMLDCEFRRTPVHINEGTPMVPFASETISSEADHLHESYGSKMLKMMGWAGGGLGKHGSGITEPIKSSKVVGRFGIGHEKRKECKTKELKNEPVKQPVSSVKKPVNLKKITDERFERGVHAVIGNFVEKLDHHEFVFSKGFSTLQCNIIQDIAEIYNLRGICFGNQGSRHVVLFRASTAKEFLKSLRDDQSLSKTSRTYQIMPPSTDTQNISYQK